MNRREFLEQTGFAGIAAAGLVIRGASAQVKPRVYIVRDPFDLIATAAPVQRAVGQLQVSLAAAKVECLLCDQISQAPTDSAYILLAGPENLAAREALHRSSIQIPATPESLVLAPVRNETRSIIVAAGRDPLALAYAVQELSDRAANSSEQFTSFNLRKPIIESPANPIRSAARLFTSEIEDKPWFYDRDFWRRYLTMLISQRFNRFSLTFGIGYDFLSEVTDSYLHFAYPFLVKVPGYDVHARGLPDEERERNLEMLRFISEEATAVGLHFQLGLWTHGYDWTRNRGVNYYIDGLTPETHASYCRDALRTLLQACPAIKGVTFRIHGESGVAEGTYEFWKTVFDGVAKCGRKVEIDMHAKGIDQAMIDLALATRMPVNVSPKFWAEHLGLPYHQASIRALEMPPKDRPDQGFFAKSDGSRRFMRYGYGDLLTEDRRYGILFRIWPGTQRLLLWGDPAMAAAYGRAGGFCGSLGMELCEPLSFKGRKGSGLKVGRNGYTDAKLRPEHDFEKYLYTYRLWGRLLYNPDASPDVWRRSLNSDFGPAAADVEAALANASRILPLVTTAHLPSAANNGYWPEMYTNMPIFDEKRPHPYSDTPTPKRFGAVSPLDPELFLSIDEFTEELRSGKYSGRYAPVEVASWLDNLAGHAVSHLAHAERLARKRKGPAFRGLAVDVFIQCGLGRFFAAKLRAGVLYSTYERNGNNAALRDAIASYRAARAAWVALSEKAKDVYASDVTFGRASHLRGNWADRLIAIDLDIEDMERRAKLAGVDIPLTRDQTDIVSAVMLTQSWPDRPIVPFQHTSPRPFQRGNPVEIIGNIGPSGGELPRLLVRLHYRRVSQVEPYRVEDMKRRGSSWRAIIPAEYTDTPFPLQYYFELRETDRRVGLYPGLNRELTNQPYFIVRQVRR